LTSKNNPQIQQTPSFAAFTTILHQANYINHLFLLDFLQIVKKQQSNKIPYGTPT
jgi:hypothetical protein